MRLGITRAAVIGLGILLPGCTGPYGLTFYGATPDGLYPYQFPRVDPQEAAAWPASVDGKLFMSLSSGRWRDASIAAGTDEASARAAADRCTAAYTGTAP